MGEAVEVWRGSVATWECDSMGQLNVSFYMAKAMEALIGLAAHLGMPHAFAPHAEATLIVREQHIRFLREAQAGARLHIDAGVLEMGEDEAWVLFLMRHHDGELGASFRMRVAHATSREGRPFPWPDWALVRARAMTIEAPEKAQPRSVSLAPVEVAASLPRALELGLKRIGLGGVQTVDCDAFGRLRTELVVTRIASSLAHLLGGLLRDRPAGQGPEPGAVILEYHLIYLDWPRAGGRYELRSGLTGADPKLRRMIHWFLDPESGRPWACAEAVATLFDLETRSTVTLTERELAAWSELSIPGLTL